MSELPPETPQPKPEPTAPSEMARVEAEEREARIKELEAKLNRPPRVGVLPPVAALALLGALGVLWLQRADVEYFGASKTPIDLGAEGDYHFDRAVSNRYTQIHGTPTGRGAYFEDKGKPWIAIGLMDTPLMVVRATLASESFEPGRKGSRPDPRPFSVRGRLLSREDTPVKYSGVFTQVDSYGEIRPKWILIAEAHPGGDFGAMVWASVLGVFALVNAWLLVRGTLFLIRGRARAD